MKGRTTDFFWYNAGPLAIDPDRPIQLCSMIGCVLGKFADTDRAQVACEALQRDRDAGTLPCDLSKWDKKEMLK